MADRVALITGATNGVGRVVAERLGGQGWHVLVHGRDRARGEQVVNAIQARGGSARFHEADLSSSCAPDWPTPPDGVGAHRVIIEGHPRIEVTVEASDEGGNRSAGGNATAVGRLVSAIDWLIDATPGLYDALDVPLRPAIGKLGRTQP